MGRLIILTTAGSLIYGLPYFRSYYYDAYLEIYHLTNTQMGTFGSIFGVLGAISYLFGGIVADMISPRMIMSVSLILTGAAGLLHLTNPSYGMLVLIYLIWGFTPLECLLQAPKNNAEILGISDTVGTIACGKKANLVAFDGNPDENIEVLSQVSLVLKAGVVVNV